MRCLNYSDYQSATKRVKNSSTSIMWEKMQTLLSLGWLVDELYSRFNYNEFVLVKKKIRGKKEEN